jgi:hypothetical protein
MVSGAWAGSRFRALWPFEPQNARAANRYSAFEPLRRSNPRHMFPYCTLHTVSFQSRKFAVINDLSPSVLNTFTNPSSTKPLPRSLQPQNTKYKNSESLLFIQILATSTVPKPTWPDNSQFSDAQVLIKYAKRAKVIRPSARSRRRGALTPNPWRLAVRRGRGMCPFKVNPLYAGVCRSW